MFSAYSPRKVAVRLWIRVQRRRTGGDTDSRRPSLDCSPRPTCYRAAIPREGCRSGDRSLLRGRGVYRCSRPSRCSHGLLRLHHARRRLRHLFLASLSCAATTRHVSRCHRRVAQRRVFWPLTTRPLCYVLRRPSSVTNESRNHALYRTAPCVTARASTATFPPTVQVALRAPQALRSGPLGDFAHLPSPTSALTSAHGYAS